MDYIPGVIVKYHGPTNYRGSRVSLDLGFREMPRKWIAYDYAQSNIYDMAGDALAKAGFEVVGVTDNQDGYTVLVRWNGAGLYDLWAKVGK